MLAGKGDVLPVSAFPVDGTWPTGTAQWEKRNLALEIPVWDPAICIQCNQCALVCPHAAIRAKVYDAGALAGAPATFKSTPLPRPRVEGHRPTRSRWRPRTAPAATCASTSARPRTRPTRATRRSTCSPQAPLRERRAGQLRVLPRAAGARPHARLPKVDAKHRSSSSRCSSTRAPAPAAARRRTSSCSPSSSATALLVANATGCSSIYGGNLPTTPYTTNRDGRGPAWANSLFEDNAEFGLGIRLARRRAARRTRARCCATLAATIGDAWSAALLARRRSTTRPAIRAARARRAVARAARRAASAGGAARSRRSPTTWCGRASGWSAATAGRTTSATAASTTSWPAARREHPRARHRGLLEHRRPAVEGDAARRGGQVRQRRQGDAEEGPRPGRR